MAMKVLYLGDAHLQGSASYLAGILAYNGMIFDYVQSEEPFQDALLENEYKLVILSDYPARNFSTSQARQVVEKVKNGTGLLMIGGWDSYVGWHGGYHKSPIGRVLPVKMDSEDDRVNTFAPCAIRRDSEHEILRGLPFDEAPPFIAGFNQFDAKKNANVLLSVTTFFAEKKDNSFLFSPDSESPLLVVSTCGQGRVAAYAGDVAPHWVGGFVDWGDTRITLQAKGAAKVEVGNWYVRFFSNLILWMAKRTF